MKDAVLTLEIRASRLLSASAVTAHLLAGMTLLAADLPWSYRVPLFMAIVMNLVFLFKQPSNKTFFPAEGGSQHTGFGAHRGLKIKCRTDGGLSVWVDKDWEAVHLLPNSLVLSWCAILRYQRAGHRRAVTCVVLPDSLNGNNLSRLRVCLKFRVPPKMQEY